MHRMTIPSELAKRITCTSATAISARNPLREELAEQIAEFEKNGGQIKEIPRGVGTYAKGEAPPPANMAICRSNERQIASKVLLKHSANDHTECGKYLNQTAAATRLGICPTYFSVMQRRGTLKINVKKTIGRVKYYAASDVAELGRYQFQRSLRDNNTA